MKGDCVVCYEITSNRTDCQHFLCHECTTNLVKRECPYCRKAFRTIIKMAWSHFCHLFGKYYRDNSKYQNLKLGIDEDCVLSDDTLHYVEHLDEFDSKSISLEVMAYTVYMNRWKRYEIMFYANGLEEEDEQHSYFFIEDSSQGRILEQYLSSTNIELFIR